MGDEWGDYIVSAPPKQLSSSVHRLRKEGDGGADEIEQPLTPFNHGPRVMPLASFNVMWHRRGRARALTT